MTTTDARDRFLRLHAEVFRTIVAQSTPTDDVCIVVCVLNADAATPPEQLLTTWHVEARTNLVTGLVAAAAPPAIVEALRRGRGRPRVLLSAFGVEVHPLETPQSLN